MIKHIKEHEEYMKEVLKNMGDADLEKVRDYHLVQIGFLQHERLVHLLVTLFFAFLLLVALAVTWNMTSTLMLVLDGLLAVMLVAYIIHYLKLENTVQRWYGLYSDICELSKGI